MICPNCNVEMIRRKSKFSESYWWGCPNFPECTITITEHPDGRIMGTAADSVVKALRIKAHKLCSAIWGDWKVRENRIAMYTWLKASTKSGHIGQMKEIELKLLIPKLEEMIEEQPDLHEDAGDRS
jgi:ssDNA-binding Zn-finger/Zn-ribbon topoisomerase 1